MRVLIVDDEKVICDGLCAMIPWADYGLQIPDTASNGAVALEKMQLDPYDVLITDVRMPVMDGLTLCQNVHTHYPNCEMIILSGYGDFQYAQKAIEFGVRRYLLKPVDEHKLEDILLEILENYNKHHTAQQNAADTAFYECDLPFSLNACHPVASIANAGKSLSRALLDGDMEQCHNTVRDFICKLRQEKPSRDVRAEYCRLFLSPTDKITKNLHLDLEYSYDALYRAENLAVLYDGVTALASTITKALAGRKNTAAENSTSHQIACYIQENYAKKLNTASVAEHFHFSAAYCGRLFKDEQGVSIIQYIHTVRIAQAKRLLVETNYKLESVALQVGYTENSNFYSQFKRLVGMTPEQYRRLSHRNKKGTE